MQTRLPKLWWNDKEKQKQKKAKPRTTKNKKLVNIAHYFQAPATQASLFPENNLLFQRIFYC